MNLWMKTLWSSKFNIRETSDWFTCNVCASVNPWLEHQVLTQCQFFIWTVNPFIICTCKSFAYRMIQNEMLHKKLTLTHVYSFQTLTQLYHCQIWHNLWPTSLLIQIFQLGPLPEIWCEQNLKCLRICKIAQTMNLEECRFMDFDVPLIFNDKMYIYRALKIQCEMFPFIACWIISSYEYLHEYYIKTIKYYQNGKLFHLQPMYLRYLLKSGWSWNKMKNIFYCINIHRDWLQVLATWKTSHII